MTTPVGQIGLSDVNAELGNSPSAQINMNSAPVRGLAGVPTGQIAMSNLQGKSNIQFVAATGGTITTSGDYKIHTFNSSGTFTVTNAGTPLGSSTVDYLVVAGGGGGGKSRGGGGGAGGYRESVPSPAAWTASPLASPGGSLPVSLTSYPITVGAGGTGAVGANPSAVHDSTPGGNSVFSTITSAGGGYGGDTDVPSTYRPGGSGGSGGGSEGRFSASGGTGNSPPTSPPQGQSGGSTNGNQVAPDTYAGSGGGGAGAVGQPNPAGDQAGAGGNGVTSSISASPVARGGGGGGASGSAANPRGNGAPGGSGGGGAGNGGAGITPTAPVPSQIDGTAGTANTGGGGGGGAVFFTTRGSGGQGGSGVVIIRYKFQ